MPENRDLHRVPPRPRQANRLKSTRSATRGGVILAVQKRREQQMGTGLATTSSLRGLVLDRNRKGSIPIVNIAVAAKVEKYRCFFVAWVTNLRNGMMPMLEKFWHRNAACLSVRPATLRVARVGWQWQKLARQESIVIPYVAPIRFGGAHVDGRKSPPLQP